MTRESLKLVWREVLEILWTDVRVLFRPRRPHVRVITFDFTDH